MPKKKSTPAADPLTLEIETVRQQLAELTERERRLQADYQNVVRRTREDKLNHSKVATKLLVGDLLDPLSNLTLASEQLSDPGLRMVVAQLWKALSDHGVEQITVLGKPFDVATMEVVESVVPEESDTAVVTTVIRPGYTLNGALLQHAKVAIGTLEQQE